MQPCPKRLHLSLGHMDAQLLISAREHEMSFHIPVVDLVEAPPCSDVVSLVGNSCDVMRPLDIMKFTFHPWLRVGLGYVGSIPGRYDARVCGTSKMPA